VAEIPGKGINFLQWMMVGLPPALALLVMAWSYLLLRYSSRDLDSAPGLSERPTTEAVPQRGERWHGPFTLAVTLLTIVLWMTGQWHGLPTAVVSFVPITLLTMTSVLEVEDVRSLPWDILLLLAGGLALGDGVQGTGLAASLVAGLPLEGLGVTPLVLLMALTAVIISNFMSNTAATNVLMPIGIALVAGNEARMAIPLALSASCAVCLPISTPPNAVVFATGRIETRDLLGLYSRLGESATGASRRFPPRTGFRSELVGQAEACPTAN
jgi:sodium-dependent dicarboxylate transporter 2/3/5